MWLLDRVRNKIKLIYQQFFKKLPADVFTTFPNTFFTLNDLSLRDVEDTVQIDHLIVGPSGLYCIQEINMPGLLSGDENLWVHEFEKKKINIRNPFELVNKYENTLRYIIRKNDKYLFAEPIKSDDIPIYPLIINSSETGRMNLKRSPYPVIKSFDLKRIVNTHSNEEFLTSDECMKLGKLLESKNTHKSTEAKDLEYR